MRSMIRRLLLAGDHMLTNTPAIHDRIAQWTAKLVVVLAICTAALPIALPGQSAVADTAVSLAFSRQFTFRSAINHVEYRVMVALPVSYAAPGDTARYPVLYILDGNDELPIAAEAQRLLRMGRPHSGTFQDVIMVGIGYPVNSYAGTLRQREVDDTPTPYDSTRNPAGCCSGAPVGGGPDLLRVIREEIIPRIDREYRTTADRGIMGHSYGGLFAMYTLFAAPDLFDRYAILSPALWWDGGVMFDRERTFAAGRSDLKKRIFMAVGAMESDSLMVQPLQQMAVALRSHDFPGLALQSVVFPDEYHGSMVPGAMSRALRFLYSPLAAP